MNQDRYSNTQPNLSNRQEFENIFRTYYLILKNYAWKYVLEEEIAEDIVQDVFVHIWDNRNTLKLKISIKSYLFTSVYNRCMNQIKHEKLSLKFKKEKTEEEKLKQYYFENTNPQHEENLDSLVKSINDAIEKMPEQQQRVFILRRKFQLKNKEIAEFLNISVKAVEKHVSKGLQHIREHLKNIIILLFF